MRLPLSNWTETSRHFSVFKIVLVVVVLQYWFFPTTTLCQETAPKTSPSGSSDRKKVSKATEPAGLAQKAEPEKPGTKKPQEISSLKENQRKLEFAIGKLEKSLADLQNQKKELDNIVVLKRAEMARLEQQISGLRMQTILPTSFLALLCLQALLLIVLCFFFWRSIKAVGTLTLALETMKVRLQTFLDQFPGARIEVVERTVIRNQPVTTAPPVTKMPPTYPQRAEERPQIRNDDISTAQRVAREKTLTTDMPDSSFRNGLINQYNKALLSDGREARDVFFDRFTPTKVDIEESPEIRKGILADENYRPRFSASSAGAILVVEDKAEDEYFLLPSFDAQNILLTPSLGMTFKSSKVDRAVKGERELQEVRMPAQCRKIDANRWELVQKGEIALFEPKGS